MYSFKELYCSDETFNTPHYSHTSDITDQLWLMVTKILSEKVNSKKINDVLFSKDFDSCEKTWDLLLEIQTGSMSINNELTLIIFQGIWNNSVIQNTGNIWIRPYSYVHVNRTNKSK